MKKKVLVIGMTPIVGGVDTFILNVFLHLNNKYKFEFLNISNKPLAYSSLIKKNGGIIRHVFIKQNYFKYFIRNHIAKKFFKEHHDYNLVDINAATVNRVFWIKAAKKYGIKHFILHSHISAADKSRLYKSLSKYLVRYNQHYVSRHKEINKWAASDKCGRWMFGKNSSFRIINNGIDTQLFYPNKRKRIIIRQKMNINNNDPVIITTSRLEYVKNYPKIINVFNKLHILLPSSKLIIIGGGSEMSYIKHLVNIYNLNSNVYFLGNTDRNDIPKYLDAADMMIMPSYHEGMPYSLLEAQSSGVPDLVSTGISKNANITGKVQYLSLKDSDNKWAEFAKNMLYNNHNFNERFRMNTIMKNSSFGLKYFINKIDKLYNKITN